jgi:putative addiction module component (TIGR02574 family)
MSVSAAALGIDRLSVAERLELIEQIWESLPTAVESAEIPQWHLDELTKRLDATGANPNAGRPWREVLNELKKPQ